ncbi:Flp pilus assembly protein CpaB [Saccharothrix saharensis]|uniref:Flp pilus assembly protein CpaB n=1 Tax=Saccharothrix saharensis TaxID=571190 RepID=A0A543JEQ8_9PSEU|nr:SAF domain-containing protein [Saccharothrix saharensis]TQM81274.1 Flp pilus assembly protein CpaB [Saccharothrix saharensis]
MLLHLRRILAGLLALAAVGVAVLPGEPAVAVAVAAHDLAPGVPLGAADVRVIAVPPSLSPSGAVSERDALGRSLVSAARSGEPLTDARLTSTDPTASSVAVRLSDPGVAGLLRPGSRVDVVGPEATVLATDASVVAVRGGEVVVLSADRPSAHRIAAETLSGPVAVILR